MLTGTDAGSQMCGLFQSSLSGAVDPIISLLEVLCMCVSQNFHIHLCIWPVSLLIFFLLSFIFLRE